MKLIKQNNTYSYLDNKTKIKLRTKNIYSKGMFENIGHAQKIALDLKISKEVIEKLYLIYLFPGRFSYLEKVKSKINYIGMRRL